jgi:hypothetical protein
VGVNPEEYLVEAEAFSRAVGTEYYLEGAGLKAGLNLTPIYTRHLQLFEGERFDEAKRWGLEPTEERYLLDFIVDGYFGQQTKTLSEQLAATEAAAIVTWDEQSVPYRQVPGMIANEADAVRRHALEQAYLDVLATMNPLREEREKRVQHDARGFNYPDYVALYDDLRGLRLGDLTEKMQAFISSTDELYFAALDTYLSEMRILRDDARKCDLARIFRAPIFDDLFPEERMLPTLHATMRDLGFLLEDQKNIRLDTEPRPLKSPRAFCSTIVVPDDVRLVIKPSGGVQDYESLLHEAGHAEHYGNVDRTLSFPYRCLGDAAVTESYAFLLEYLMHEPRWLFRHLGIARPDSFFQVAGFHKLYFLRRYGTKLIYEQELHRADEPNDVAEYYDELFTRNLGAGYGPESYLADVDGGFYAAQYVRAWIFEAQHRQYLQREFDDEWFRNPKAGKFLVELWRDGQRHPVEELADFMGYAGLDLGPVTEEINALMGAA